MNRAMNRRNFLKATGVGAVVLAAPALAAEKKRPNIVWVVAEDMSCHFGYNGEKLVKTPNVDKMAAEGVVFSNAYITCPVCSPGRSAMVTGMYQTSIGAHNHRSSRGTEKITLPGNIKLIPNYFRQAGYYVVNCAGGAWDKAGKTDYNFTFDPTTYDKGDWTERKEGQPFFAQVQLHGGKNRKAKVPNPVDPVKVTLPPYYPADPVLQEDWARYLDSVVMVDIEIGKVMKALKTQGEAENTVVIFITDHGISHARGKQFLYEEGVHIPFIVWAPGRVKAGVVRDDMIAHIDMGATSMHLAGIPIPEYLESRPLFSPDYKPRDFVVSARDRCDETVDRLRSVRKSNWKYIRNYLHHRPHLQPCAYKDAKPILIRLREMHAEGTLSKMQDRVLFSPERAPEELYNLSKDPWELNNLARKKRYNTKLEELRGDLAQWVKETGDMGQKHENMAMYDSDMKVYVDGMDKRGRKEYADTVRANIAQHKKWLAEGK